MEMKNLLLFFLLCALPLKIAAAEKIGSLAKLPSTVELAVLPSEVTATFLGDESVEGGESISMGGTLRDIPVLPDPGKEAPIGSGLGLLTLCAGAYLLNSKKRNKK